MLALPIALLLALPAGDAVATEGRTAQDPSVPPQTLIPYGSAQGSWVAGTLYDDGILVALLEDAAGRPVFVMDARLTPSGHIDGVLRPLEYATNPVLGLPSLYVDGQAKISAEGDGTFEAMIATPMDGAIPVHPFGRIEGVLLPGMRRAKPGQHPSSGISEGAVLAGEHKRIRGLLQHPGSGDGAAVLASATAAGSYTEIDPQDGAAVVVCPFEPQLVLAGSASAGQVSAIGGSVSGTSGSVVQVRLADAGAHRFVDASEVPSSSLQLAEVASAGNLAEFGAQSSDVGLADAGAHRHQEPLSTGSANVEWSAAGAFGEIGSGAVSYRLGKTDAGARRIIDPLSTGSSNVEQGAAGAHRETEPGVPPFGEGRVRARWYLLP